VNSSAKLGPSASIETSYAPVDSSSPSADPMLSPQSDMTACALLPVIPTKEVEERPQSRPADPPDDDPQAGTATKPPSDPPQRPEGRNQHNCLGLNWLEDKPDSTPGMGVTYYGYRWFDPVTGRWPSRDPIGERGGLNLYGVVNNNPVSLIDLLGMLIKRYSARSAPVTEISSEEFIARFPGATEETVGVFWSGWPDLLYENRMKHWPVTCDGCVLKVHDAELSPEIFIVHGWTEKDGADGMNTVDHERIHERIFEVLWNYAADEINLFDGHIAESKKCCEKWRDYLNTKFALYAILNSIADSGFDNHQYGAPVNEAAIWIFHADGPNLPPNVNRGEGAPHCALPHLDYGW
jgi:RHS repeat-associated protein